MDEGIIRLKQLVMNQKRERQFYFIAESDAVRRLDLYLQVLYAAINTEFEAAMEARNEV